MVTHFRKVECRASPPRWLMFHLSKTYSRLNLKRSLYLKHRESNLIIIYVFVFIYLSSHIAPMHSNWFNLSWLVKPMQHMHFHFYLLNFNKTNILWKKNSSFPTLNPLNATPQTMKPYSPTMNSLPPTFNPLIPTCKSSHVPMPAMPLHHKPMLLS